MLHRGAATCYGAAMLHRGAATCYGAAMLYRGAAPCYVAAVLHRGAATYVAAMLHHGAAPCYGAAMHPSAVSAVPGLGVSVLFSTSRLRSTLWRNHNESISPIPLHG